MSFTTTVAADYKIPAHDAGESVTLTQTPLASPTATALTFVDSHELDIDEMIAAGIALIGVRAKHFSLPAEQITGKVLPGDRLLDTSGELPWEIVKASLDDLSICWECDAKQDR